MENKRGETGTPRHLQRYLYYFKKHCASNEIGTLKYQGIIKIK